MKNFCCHADKEVFFKEGVTGIIGENGSGKTAIVDALCFAFVGNIADVNKDDLVMRGSYGDSSVKVDFLLNDIPGSITRYPSSSKVTLDYGDQHILKSTEVNEVWNRLLQVDAHVFKHVIVARQNHIPELFTGDISVRERAFQKIFMVPDTDKLRNVIYSNYLKNAPPRLPEENMAALTSELEQIQAELSRLRTSHSTQFQFVLGDLQYSGVISALDNYRKCKINIEAKPNLEKKIEEIDRQYKEDSELLLNFGITENIDILQSQKDDLIRQKTLWESKLALIKQKDDVVIKLDSMVITTGEQYASTVQEQKLVEQQLIQLNGKSATTFSKIEELQKENSDLSSLTDKVVCPTCKQVIPNIHTYVLDNNEKIEKLKSEREQILARRQDLVNKNKIISSSIDEYIGIRDKASYIITELNKYNEVQFDPNELLVLDRRILFAKEQKNSRIVITGRIEQLKFEKKHAEEKLLGLSCYEGTLAELIEEISLLEQVITVNQNRRVELQNTGIDIAKKETELQLLQQRIAVSVLNTNKNVAIDKYNNTLKSVYDVFHVSQFSRMLISSFSSVVQDKINENVQFFEFPYSIRIDDGFQIVAVDPAGRDLPRVSGGQAVVIGMCLRLALHSMFSQSFPLMIFDEPSTNMSATKLPLLWSMIEKLKNSRLIKQLIIIDHNEGLMNVVDNIIKL